VSRHLIVAALLLICSAASAQLTDAQLRGSVVSIAQTGYFGNVNGHGTGFFISKERLITAAHIGDSAATVQMRDGRVLPCYYERISRVLDWAILRVPGANAVPLKLGNAGATGESVWAYGNFDYNHGGIQVTVGQCEGCTADGYRTATAPVYPGYSGGPIVVKGGKVIGITSQQRLNCGHAVIYVPIESVKQAAGL
jgi:S1-C subfamily serine protease